MGSFSISISFFLSFRDMGAMRTNNLFGALIVGIPFPKADSVGNKAPSPKLTWNPNVSPDWSYLGTQSRRMHTLGSRQSPPFHIDNPPPPPPPRHPPTESRVWGLGVWYAAFFAGAARVLTFGKGVACKAFGCSMTLPSQPH